jgi:hypothetical protein
MRAALSFLKCSPEDLQQIFTWYLIRDMLLGENEVKQDFRKAFQLAAICNHPDAIWLTKLFPWWHMRTKKEAIQVFLDCEDDPRALCFAALLDDEPRLLKRSAEMGNALAQAERSSTRMDEKGFQWAQKSATQQERDGFLYLGYCYEKGAGCEQDFGKAKENLLIAAELGSVDAMDLYAKCLHKNDPQRYIWLGQSAARGHPDSLFLSEMKQQMEKLNSGTGHAKVVFAIGRALKGHINVKKRSIFGDMREFGSYVFPAKQAFEFYTYQVECYRSAVDNWTLVGMKNGVVKDIRLLIGKLIWDLREEAEYTWETR